MRCCVIYVTLALQTYSQLFVCLSDRQCAVHYCDVVVCRHIGAVCCYHYSGLLCDRSCVCVCFDSACAELYVMGVSTDKSYAFCGRCHFYSVDRYRRACVFLSLALACECHRPRRDRQRAFFFALAAVLVAVRHCVAECVSYVTLCYMCDLRARCRGNRYCVACAKCRCSVSLAFSDSYRVVLFTIGDCVFVLGMFVSVICLSVRCGYDFQFFRTLCDCQRAVDIRNVIVT